MGHKGTVRLETGRLVLRRFTPEDLEPFYRHCLSDEAVWRWTNYPKMESLADVREKGGLFTEKWFAAYSRLDRYSWALAQKPEGPAIGRVFGMHPDSGARDVELAYELGRAFWGRGYMTEAVGVVLRFFFEDVGFARIHCWHADRNPASGRVMEKCGLHPLGVTPCAGVCNGGVFHRVDYALTREAYFRQRGALGNRPE